MLLNNPYEDIEESPDALAILRVRSIGLMEGTSETTFSPNAVVTREQAARLDDHLAAGAMCFVVAGFGNGDVFRIPWEVWRDMKAHFGHKYATPEELEAYKVPLGRNGVLLLLD